jgi:Cu/Ag efflux protein CusF
MSNSDSNKVIFEVEMIGVAAGESGLNSVNEKFDATVEAAIKADKSLKDFSNTAGDALPKAGKKTQTAIERIDEAAAKLKTDMEKLSAAIAAGGENVELYKVELDKLIASQAKELTLSEQLDKSTIKLKSDIDQLRKAIASGAGDTAVYKNELQKLLMVQDQMQGKTPILYGHMNQLAGAKRNVGQAALEASRGIEDLQYGFGGIVNNIPSMVMAFGGGAGLTAAISLTAVAANQLWMQFTKVAPETKKATDEAKEYVDSLKQKIIDAKKELTQLKMGDYTDSFLLGEKFIETTKQFDKEFSSLGGAKNTGIDSWRKRAIKDFEQMQELQKKGFYDDVKGGDEKKAFLEKNKQLFEKYRAEEEALAATFRAKTKKAQHDQLMELQKMEEEEREKKLEDEKRANEKAAKERKDAAIKYEKDALEARLKITQDYWKAWDEKIKENADEQKERAAAANAVWMAEVAQLKEAEKLRLKAIQDQKKLNAERQKQLLDINRGDGSIMSMGFGKDAAAVGAFGDTFGKEDFNHLDAIEEAEWNSLQRRYKAQEQYYANVAAITERVTGAMLQIGEEYVKAKIDNEKNAELAVIASISRVAGQSLVGYGVQSIGQAAAYAASQNWPAAGAAAAIGAGLIVTGVGLGGVSYGISGAIANQKKEDAAALKEAERDKGNSGRIGTDKISNDGKLVLNINYGVMGPMPEETARMVHEAVKTAQKRGG